MRALLLLSVIAGCAAIDPLERAGLWRPIGANEANLGAMIADPQDLVNGQPALHADGAVLAEAVARYRLGRVRALPDSDLAKLTLGGSGGGAAAGASLGPN